MFVGSARLPGSVLEHWQFEGQFSGVQSGTWPVRGAALLAPLLATLVLQFFVGGLKGDHLAQIAIQQSLLVSPCKIGCVREACKGARGTQAFICAHNNVWAVGFAFTIMLVLLSVLWSDFCEEQVCLHACYQLMHKMDREVDMYVMDGRSGLPRL